LAATWDVLPVRNEKRDTAGAQILPRQRFIARRFARGALN
jgi:hypothetical protein